MLIKPLTSTAIPVDDPIAAIELFMESGWTDGLPVFPPTREAVQRMIDYVGRDPQEVLGTVFPGDGEATIENVATTGNSTGRGAAAQPARTRTNSALTISAASATRP